jgi:hypothetical protein
MRFAQIGKNRSSINHGLKSYAIKPSKFVQKELVDKCKYWRSLADRSTMYDKIQAYFDKDFGFNCDWSSDHMKSARKTIEKDFLSKVTKLGKLAPFTLSKSAKCMPQDTSPGFPYTKLGITKKRDAIPYAMKYLSKNLAQMKSWRDCPPCLAGTRLSLCKKDENKPRLTWGYPISMTILEGRFLLPIMVPLKSDEKFAWSWNWLGGYSDHLCKYLYKCRSGLGVDMRSFDSRVHQNYIKWAFSLIKRCFIMNKEDARQFKLVEDYFIHTPLYMYDSLYVKERGVPSGSFFTQLVDSLVNRLWHTSFFHSIDETMVRFECYLGDDSVIGLNDRFNDQDKYMMEIFFYNEFGAEIHPEKGFNWNATWFGSRRTEFLGKVVDGSYNVEVDDDLIIGQICYPEKEDKSPDDTLTRLVGVKWMSGTSESAHRICNSVCQHLIDTYPSVSYTDFSREMKAIFKYLLFWQPSNISYPSNAEVTERYRQYHKSYYPEYNLSAFKERFGTSPIGYETEDSST